MRKRDEEKRPGQVTSVPLADSTNRILPPAVWHSSRKMLVRGIGITVVSANHATLFDDFLFDCRVLSKTWLCLRSIAITDGIHIKPDRARQRQCAGSRRIVQPPNVPGGLDAVPSRVFVTTGMGGCILHHAQLPRRNPGLPALESVFSFGSRDSWRTRRHRRFGRTISGSSG